MATMEEKTAEGKGRFQRFSMMDELVRERGGAGRGVQKRNNPDFCCDVKSGNAGQQNVWGSHSQKGFERLPKVYSIYKVLYIRQGAQIKVLVCSCDIINACSHDTESVSIRK